MNITLSSASKGLRIAILSTICMSAGALYGQTILDSWDFSDAGNTLNGSGWSGWGSAGSGNATDYTNTYSTDSANPRVGRTEGSGTNKAAFFRTGTTSGSYNDRLVITTSFTAADNLGVVSWDQSFTHPASTSLRLLVEVDGLWYASVSSYTVSAAGSAANATTNVEGKSLDLSGPSGLGTTGWQAITFGTGVPISLGAQVVSPIGTSVTGIGFYVETTPSDRVAWIDNVQLSSTAVIPESASATLLFGVSGLGLALAARRRR